MFEKRFSYFDLMLFNSISTDDGLGIALIIGVVFALSFVFMVIYKYYGFMTLLTVLLGSIGLILKGRSMRNKARTDREVTNANRVKLSSLGLILLVAASTVFVPKPWNLDLNNITAHPFSQVLEDNGSYYFLSETEGKTQEMYVDRSVIDTVKIIPVEERSEMRFKYVPKQFNVEDMTNVLHIYLLSGNVVGTYSDKEVPKIRNSF